MVPSPRVSAEPNSRSAPCSGVMVIVIVLVNAAPITNTNTNTPGLKTLTGVGADAQGARVGGSTSR